MKRHNYRPISILSYLKFFRYTLAPSTCLQGLSLLWNICKYDLWISPIDQGKMNAIVWINFSKTFDCVDNVISLHKLTNYGIPLKALNWYKLYLLQQSQQMPLSEPVFHRPLSLALYCFLYYSNDHTPEGGNCMYVLFVCRLFNNPE